MKQATFEGLAFSAKKKRTRRETFLAEMERVVPWAALEAVIEPHYPKAGRRGGQPKALGAMLRIYFMQQWYALSDPGMEGALYEIESMRRFAGLELIDDAVPDGANAMPRSLLISRDGTAYRLNGGSDFDARGSVTSGEAASAMASRLYGGVSPVTRTLVDPGDAAGSGSVDGQFGPDISAAITASQHANGRSMSDLLDGATGHAVFDKQTATGTGPSADVEGADRVDSTTAHVPVAASSVTIERWGKDLLQRARQVRLPAHVARVALCIVRLIAGLLAVSGASFAADTGRFDGEGGDAASTLPEAIRNGLRLDEFVLSCNAATPGHELSLTALKFAVYRIDFNSDGRSDWLVAGTDPCLRQADGLPWWGFAAMAIDEGGDEHGDGPPRILKAIAESVQLEDASATGYADLRLYRAGPDVLYRYADGRYVAQASPESRAGSTPVSNGDPMWAASPRMLADFRLSPAPLDELGDGPETQRLLRQAFGAARPPLLGSVTGAFTSPTACETLLLVRAGGSRAAAQPPFGRHGAELLRYVDGALSARHALAPQAGNAIVAAPDPDGDGMQILLMRNDDMNMGVLTTSLILLRLTPEQAVVLQVFKGVREDGCEGPPSAQRVSASIVYWQGEPKPGGDASAYVLQRFVADCPEAGRKLDASDFEAVGN